MAVSYSECYRGDWIKVSTNILRLNELNGFTSAEIIGQTKDAQDDIYAEKGIDSIKSLLEVNSLKDAENHLIIKLK